MGTVQECCEMCLEHVLRETPHKTAAIRPPASHLTNHPNKTSKTCLVSLEKQGLTHKCHSLLDVCIWTCQCWLTNNFSSVRTQDAGLETCQRATDDRDEWWEKESQGTLCSHHDLIIMMTIYENWKIWKHKVFSGFIYSLNYLPMTNVSVFK